MCNGLYSVLIIIDNGIQSFSTVLTFLVGDNADVGFFH